MNYQWHRNCQWEGFRLPQKSQEHAAAEPLLPLLLLLICACTASAHTLFSLTYILSISLGERFGVLSSSFIPPGQFEYGLVLFLFCFFLSLFFPQSSRGYRCGLNTFYSSPPSSPDFWRAPWPLWWTQPGWGSQWTLRCCPGLGGYSPSSPTLQCTAPYCPRGLKKKKKATHKRTKWVYTKAVTQTWVKCAETSRKEDWVALEHWDFFNQTSIWVKLVLVSTHPGTRGPCFSSAYRSLSHVMTLVGSQFVKFLWKKALAGTTSLFMRQNVKTWMGNN